MRSSLSLRMVLGLTSKLPSYKLRTEHNPLRPGHANQLLQLAAAHWQRQLDDLDLHWIHLEFMQLDTVSQLNAILMATSFLNRGQYITDKTERAYTMRLTDTVPKDILDRLQSSLASLDAALLAKDPMMPQHLRNTHSLLISYPETVHLLDDAEIAKIVDAAEVHTKTEIVKAAAAGKSSAGSRKKVDVSDL